MNKDAIEAQTETLFTRLCHGVIAFPKEFHLHKTHSGDRLTKYNIVCHKADAARILGRGGERFRALKALMGCAGKRQGRMLLLESLEQPTIGTIQPWPKFEYNAKWPSKAVRKLLQETCDAVFRFPVNLEFEQMEDRAVFIVLHDSQEPVLLVNEITPALQNVFLGIGVTNGCHLSIDVIPDGEQ